MVSLKLVLRSPVLGTKIKALELGLSSGHAERDPDKPTQVRTRIRCGIAAQIDFDCAILKRGPRNYCQPARVIKAIRPGIYNAYGRAPEVCGRLSFHVAELELVKCNRPWSFSHQPERPARGARSERGQDPYDKQA